MTTRPSAKSRPSAVGIGTGTVIPSRSRYRSSSVSHARSAWLRWPRRPTASCPLTRTLHTSFATPVWNRSMRATSSPHWSSASHPISTSSRRAAGGVHGSLLPRPISPSAAATWTSGRGSTP